MQGIRTAVQDHPLIRLKNVVSGGTAQKRCASFESTGNAEMIALFWNTGYDIGYKKENHHEEERSCHLLHQKRCF